MQSESLDYFKMLREPKVVDLVGTSRSTLWMNVQEGYFPPPVKVGSGRAVAWPYGEVLAVVRARVAGKSNEEIRRLVRELVSARAVAA